LTPVTFGKNLILNPYFDIFFYKPIPIIYNGQSMIEDWIPWWKTPGRFTSDYLSDIRQIDSLDYKYLLDTPFSNKFNYVGLALYKDSDSYSEYIQGKLVKPLTKGKMYCFKTSIILSSYSGFSVNHLRVFFSKKPITIFRNEPLFWDGTHYSPQIQLSLLQAYSDQFATLYDYFVSSGEEQYISIGRFSPLEGLELVRRENIPQSQFGLEKSAYYLIDQVELFEIEDSLECNCKRNILPIDTIKNKPIELFETDLNKLKLGVPVVLENVNFEFNSYRLLKSADNILNTLLDYLNDNPDIRISIEGHTDDIGTEEYNLDLSINRAKSVYNWLVNNGIDSNRLRFIGFGKSRRLYNDTEDKHRALNRRVEVQILKN
jgi:outer membrane protein OmpA-like peptidoglycan-associated protein